jgi:hypothetical protein
VRAGEIREKVRGGEESREQREESGIRKKGEGRSLLKAELLNR